MAVTSLQLCPTPRLLPARNSSTGTGPRMAALSCRHSQVLTKLARYSAIVARSALYAWQAAGIVVIRKHPLSFVGYGGSGLVEANLLHGHCQTARPDAFFAAALIAVITLKSRAGAGLTRLCCMPSYE
jgi:hypothetical protein